MDDMEEEEPMEEEEAPEEVTFDEIEKLESLGVNATDVNKLKAAGIFTVAGVRMQTKKVTRYLIALVIDCSDDWIVLDKHQRIIRSQGGENSWCCEQVRSTYTYCKTINYVTYMIL